MGRGEDKALQLSNKWCLHAQPSQGRAPGCWGSSAVLTQAHHQSSTDRDSVPDPGQHTFPRLSAI